MRLILGLLLLLAGCAQNVWVKDSASDQDFAADSYRCERDTRQSGYFGGGLIGVANAQGFMNRCMVASGWRLVPSSNAASLATQSNDIDARASAASACIAAGIKPDDAGYYVCFQSHLPTRR